MAKQESKKKFIIMVSGLMLLFCGIWLAINLYRSKYTLDITQYELSSLKLTEALRVVHLTDLHNSEFGEHNEKLVSLIQDQSPDLILLTGDMLNSYDESVEIAKELICSLVVIAPVYYSFGNHEDEYQKQYGTDLKEIFEVSGAVVLEQSYEEVEVKGQKLRIGGVFGYCLPEEYINKDSAEYRFLTDFQDTDACKLLLCHMPLCWQTSGSFESWDVDYVFSGHAHGGQIILPFLGGLYAPDMPWFPGHMEGLWYAQDDMRALVLSGGLGSSGRIPRWNNLPEIVVTDIVPIAER